MISGRKNKVQREKKKQIKTIRPVGPAEKIVLSKNIVKIRDPKNYGSIDA